MNIRDIRAEEFALRASAYRHAHNHNAHFWPRAMSRRQFARTASAVVVGAALGAGLWRPGLAEAKKGPRESHEPIPIPGGTPVLGGSFHVFAPGPAGIGLDPIDAEPATITDFNGFLGLAYISGQVTQTNTATGEALTLPFVNSDMRFMKGIFRGTDDRTHQGAFALV